MSENTYKPRNFRIVRHVTKNRILDIQDTLEIDKLRVELVEFVEGEGAKVAVEHFGEPDALALVFHDILEGRPFEKYIEFKGSAQGEAVTSRVLVIERVEARNPLKITVSRGPGKVVGQGAIQPLGKPEASLSVLLSEFDARRIALTVLRHLAAYEAATYHARVAAGTRRPASEEEPSAPAPLPSEGEGRECSASASRPLGSAAREESEQAAPEPASTAIAREPVAEAPPAPRPSAAPRARRVGAPAVETYWMAAERLGVPRAEAERMLQDVSGDWGRAWSALRAHERQAQRG